MNKKTDITVAIVAYNAEATLERCLTSALKATSGPILLVDDYSNDDTARMGADICGDQITVVRPTKKIGVGNARQTALDHISTPYAVWLDADDELLPHRVAVMRKELLTHEFVFDTCELVGTAGEILARHQMPDFLAGPGLMRLFERSWLPGLFGAFRTGVARQVGYDVTFRNSEDYDFLLRALASEKKVKLLDQVGYRYHHLPTTLSRDLDAASHYTGEALGKHKPATLKTLFKKRGVSPAQISYLLACHAASTNDHDRLIAYLAELPQDTLPVTPYGRSAADIIRHLIAVALMSRSEWKQAVNILLDHPVAAAEWSNNLGVCLARLGDLGAARKKFEEALELLPGYLDATRNLDAETPIRITRLPLRPKPIRGSYT